MASIITAANYSPKKLRANVNLPKYPYKLLDEVARKEKEALAQKHEEEEVEFIYIYIYI